MIKRIIFDVDNTLIMWKEIYDYNNIKHSLEEFGINNDDKTISEISQAVQSYEKCHEYFNKEKMAKYIKTQTNINIDVNFINIWTNNLAIYGVPKEPEKGLIETLEYLKQKYELVILTNWFGQCQLNRIKNIGIDKYFSKIYCAETVKMKPSKESFLSAIGNNKPEECAMVGDDLNKDILGAINAGLKGIWINNQNIEKIKGFDYIEISKISELKNIL